MSNTYTYWIIGSEMKSTEMFWIIFIQSGVIITLSIYLLRVLACPCLRSLWKIDWQKSPLQPENFELDTNTVRAFLDFCMLTYEYLFARQNSGIIEAVK